MTPLNEHQPCARTVAKHSMHQPPEDKPTKAEISTASAQGNRLEKGLDVETLSGSTGFWALASGLHFTAKWVWDLREATEL